MLKGLRVPPRNLCGISPYTDCEQQLISALKVSLCLGSSVLSLLRLPMYHRLGGLSNRHLFSHSPAGWEVQGQGASLTGFPVRAFFLAVHCHHSVLVGGQGAGETFLLGQPHPYLWKLSPDTVTRWVGSSMWILRRYHSIYNKFHVINSCFCGYARNKTDNGSGKRPQNSVLGREAREQ